MEWQGGGRAVEGRLIGETGAGELQAGREGTLRGSSGSVAGTQGSCRAVADRLHWKTVGGQLQLQGSCRAVAGQLHCRAVAVQLQARRVVAL